MVSYFSRFTVPDFRAPGLGVGCLHLFWREALDTGRESILRLSPGTWGNYRRALLSPKILSLKHSANILLRWEVPVP